MIDLFRLVFTSDITIGVSISVSQQAFDYRAVSIWNSLPNNIRELKSLKHFKLTLKNHLLANWKQRLPWAYITNIVYIVDLYAYDSL